MNLECSPRTEYFLLQKKTIGSREVYSKQSRTFILLALAVLSIHTFGWVLLHGQSACLEVDSASAQFIARLLEQQIQENHLAGMAALAVRADGVVGVGAAGIRHQGQSAHIDVHDMFHLGSNTKAITATMIARLIEAEKLSWTTTPLDVFPEIRNSIHPALKSITLEQLLSHHAGIPPYTDTDEKEFRALPKLRGSAKGQRLKFTKWVLQHEPAIAPGTKGAYSNGGYTIAAAMAERVTGSTWETLINEQVLASLEIHAIFEWPATSDKNQPWGHVETKKGLQPQDPTQRDEQLPPFLLPAGGMAMSICDYGRFLQEHLKGLEGRPGKFLSAESIKQLHTSTLQDKFALGWGIYQIDGVPSSAHTGSAGSFYAVAAIQPSRDIAVAVFANSGEVRSKAACAAALKALLAEYAVASIRLCERQHLC